MKGRKLVRGKFNMIFIFIARVILVFYGMYIKLLDLLSFNYQKFHLIDDAR